MAVIDTFGAEGVTGLVDTERTGVWRIPLTSGVAGLDVSAVVLWPRTKLGIKVRCWN